MGSSEFRSISFCSSSAPCLGPSHPRKWESSFYLPPPIPPSLTQVNLPFPTTLSAFATHSIIPWPFCFSNTTVLASILFPAELQQGPLSPGVSGVSSLCLCLQRWLFYFDVFLLAAVWCITHPTQCAICIIQCSYERSKQWDARAAVICLKMSPFWESQTADKIYQSTVLNIVKTGKDSFQTCFKRRKSKLLRQALKVKVSQKLINQSINQLIMDYHTPGTFVYAAESTEQKRQNPCSPGACIL